MYKQHTADISVKSAVSVQCQNTAVACARLQRAPSTSCIWFSPGCVDDIHSATTAHTLPAWGPVCVWRCCSKHVPWSIGSVCLFNSSVVASRPQPRCSALFRLGKGRRPPQVCTQSNCMCCTVMAWVLVVQVFVLSEYACLGRTVSTDRLAP